ncbi:MAG: hypothetical protein GTN40_05250 [Candidatus Aenigmarchaeota archaeon]|nr:hypothetical protein [Candidatus Aenigmarchaeota archaeon]
MPRRVLVCLIFLLLGIVFLFYSPESWKIVGVFFISLAFLSFCLFLLIFPRINKKNEEIETLSENPLVGLTQESFLDPRLP